MIALHRHAFFAISGGLVDILQIVKLDEPVVREAAA
jgi:hypothetical protein